MSYFSRKSKDLIMKSNENSLLRDKKSRLSLEKSSFLLDRWGCISIIIIIIVMIIVIRIFVIIITPPPIQ